MYAKPWRKLGDFLTQFAHNFRYVLCTGKSLLPHGHTAARCGSAPKAIARSSRLHAVVSFYCMGPATGVFKLHRLVCKFCYLRCTRRGVFANGCWSVTRTVMVRQNQEMVRHKTD